MRGLLVILPPTPPPTQFLGPAGIICFSVYHFTFFFQTKSSDTNKWRTPPRHHPLSCAKDNELKLHSLPPTLHVISPGPVLRSYGAGKPAGVVFLLARESALHVSWAIPEEISGQGDCMFGFLLAYVCMWLVCAYWPNDVLTSCMLSCVGSLSRSSHCSNT